MNDSRVRPCTSKTIPPVSKVVRRWHLQHAELSILDLEQADGPDDLETSHQFSLGFRLEQTLLGVMLELQSSIEVEEHRVAKLDLKLEFEFHFDGKPELTAPILESYIKYTCLPFVMGLVRSKAQDLLSDFEVHDHLLPYFLEHSLQETDMSEHISNLIAGIQD